MALIDQASDPDAASKPTSAALIAAGQASESDRDTLLALVRQLTEALDVRYAFVAECLDEPATRVTMLAFWDGSGPGENVTYDLAGTPCEQVVGGKVCLHPRSLQRLFPDDADLKTLSAESYLGVPLRDSAGRAIGHLAVLDDRIMDPKLADAPVLRVCATLAVTELCRRRRSRVADSVEIRQALSEDADEAITETDEHGVFVYVSPNHERILGYEPKELLGTSARDLTHPEDRDRPSEHFFQISRPGEQLRKRSRFRHKSGKWVRVETTARAFVTPRGEKRVMTMARELSGASQAEGVARSGPDRYRALADNASDCICELDAEGRFIYVNPRFSEMTGWERDEMIGRLSSDFHPPDDQAGVRETLRQSPGDAQSDIDAQREVRFRKKDGSYLWFESSVRSYLTADGEPRIVGIGRNISARVRTEERHRRLEARVQQLQKIESLAVLAGGIAHDFNNILVGVVGGADLVAQSLPEGASQLRDLEQIQYAAERASELADQMLAYAGKGAMSVDTLDLNDLVGGVSHLVRASIDKGARLHFDLSRNPLAVDVDDTQIRQVVMNLITNAAEATVEGGGTIQVRTGSIDVDSAAPALPFLGAELSDGIYCFAEVSDDGCGMDLETQSRVFDPFFTTKFTGRGLGLAATLGIVRSHRGAIQLQSELGKGTTFTVLLPQSQASLDRSTITRSPSSPGSGLVLVVDDEVGVREIARRMLEASGFRVLMADDGETALKIYRRHSSEVQAVLLDLVMPRFDGTETLRALRELDPKLPIVLMSGYSEADALKRFGSSDASAFIKKPYRSAELLAKLENLIA